MLELKEKSKKELLNWKPGEGIVFLRARNNRIIGLNAHLGENGKLYIGEDELRFDMNKIKEAKTDESK